MRDEIDPLRDLGKQLPYDRPDAARRDAVRSSLLVAASEGRPPGARGRWLLVGGAFAAGALAAAAVAILVFRSPPDARPAREALATIESSTAAELQRSTMITPNGTHEVVRVRSGTIRLAMPAVREGDHVRVQTGDAEVEGSGVYEVVVAADALASVTVTTGTATVRLRGQHQAVFLAAGEAWRPSVITADLDIAPVSPEVSPAVAPSRAPVAAAAPAAAPAPAPAAAPSLAPAVAPSLAPAAAVAPAAAAAPAVTPPLSPAVAPPFAPAAAPAVAVRAITKPRLDRSAATTPPSKPPPAARSAVTAPVEPTPPAARLPVAAPVAPTPAPTPAPPPAARVAVTAPVEPTPAVVVGPPAIGSSPTETSFRAGYALLRERKFTQAALELGKAADGDGPLSADARYFQAVALTKARRSGDAERALLQFIDRAAASVRRGRAIVMLARLLAARGERTSARAWFEEAVRDADASVVAAARAGLAAL